VRHAAHRIHDNSREAFHEEHDKLGRRAQAVLDWVKAHGPCTDRDVMRGLGFTDGNAVKPRISELVQRGLLEELHTKAICPITHKRVRLVRAATEPKQQEMFA